MNIHIPKLREHLTKFQFNKMFVESLGWEHPTGPMSGKIKIDEYSIPYSCVAEIGKVPVLKFSQDIFKQFESNSERKKFHKSIKNRYHNHLVLFSDEEKFFSLSYLSKKGQVRTHSYFKEQSGDYFISKLEGIHFDIEGDEPKIAKIRNKLEKTFNTEIVTKKFFENFKNNHCLFMEYVSGIKNKEEKKWFASLILNRLMFIWFLQKKEFVNDDLNYLETKMEESKKRGKDRYYSEFLTCLFFEGFAKKSRERSEKSKKLLGKIKYLNGGLFIPHPIEEKYKNKIKIQDKAFDETFTLFNKYDWLLHGKEGKSENEISPDIMGYIFEKYINELQQKSLGAYYTRDEITSYLSRNTIQNCILDKVNKQEQYNFKTLAEMLHKLDTSLCKLLLTNENSILNTLTVLDPAVGSGAFLVSAMEELIDIYSPIIGKIETLGDRELTNWLKDFKAENKSVLYGIKKNIILKNLYGVDIMKEATEVCKLRLFLSLVSSALNKEELEPLPNMDFNIMCGNSLIGFLNEKDIEKQLSLLETGNQLSYSEIKNKYNNLVNQYKNKPLSFEKLKELKNKTQNFLEEHNENLTQILADKCDEAGLKYNPIKDINGKKKIFGNKRTVSIDDFYSKNSSRNLNPFHWDFAFNEIMNKGGFDVIITNPPWEKVKSEDKEFFVKYDSSLRNRKRCKKSVINKIKSKFFTNTKIKKKYIKVEEYYQFQRSYFSTFYQYQTGEIINEDGTVKKASSDMESYRLFIERYFDLLQNKGFLGAVLPRGFNCDEGAFGLRKHILENRKVEGLITFVNGGKGKPIFEGVGSTVQFLFLNLKKDKPQDEFPCHFQERDLKILANFPEKNTMKQSINTIKELQPRDYSIIEFKHPKDIKILEKARCFPKLSEKIKNSWNPTFYTEFHETNDSHLFENKKLSNNHLPLYVGKAIKSFQFNYDLSHVNRYISLKCKKAQGRGKAFKSKYFTNCRLVFRSIVSTGDEKLISAIIPKNHFISNSLQGVYIETNNVISSLKSIKSESKNQLIFNSHKGLKIKKSNQHMFLLQALFNSFIINYFIGQSVYLNMNFQYLYKLHIPRLTEKDDYFKELVERSAKLTCIGKEFDELADEIGVPRGGITDQQKRWEIQGEIDAMVAYIYDLSEKEFKHILDTFTTGKNQERLQALKKYAFEAFKKDKFSKKPVRPLEDLRLVILCKMRQYKMKQSKEILFFSMDFFSALLYINEVFFNPIPERIIKCPN